MHAASSSSETEAVLSLKRQIDAICDRFEEAWSAGEQPRIEDYLSKLPGSERGQLFQELLASELAIRQPVDPDVSYSDYLTRFPEYQGCILEAFSNRSTLRIAADDGPENRGKEELIAKVRQRLNSSQCRHELQLSEMQPSTDANRLPKNPEPMADQIWIVLIRAARLRTAAKSAGNEAELQAIAIELIKAFPTSRREIMLSLLLGQTIAQTAVQHQATERTVTATLQAAIDLLSRLALK